jgi:hypothetical protein
MEASPRGHGAVANRAAIILLALIGVSLLNEYVLKAAFHNWLTGKLSDFVGVAAFALFWCMLFPQARRLILLGTAAGFAFWKSPAADGLISALNNTLPFSVGRVVDWTDLIALTVLIPIARLTRDRATRFERKKKWELAIIPLALFSFVAHEGDIPPFTEFTYDQDYSFEVSADSLKQLIRGLPGPTRLVQEDANGNLYLNIPWSCPSGLFASTYVIGTTPPSTLRLKRLSAPCDNRAALKRAGYAVEWTKDRLRALFEDSVVSTLRARISVSSAPRR